VKNFGISQEEVDRQFAFGREFYALPLEEKLKFHNAEDLARGEYNGYRPAGHRMYDCWCGLIGSLANMSSTSLGNGIRDNVQVYNIPKFDGHHQRQQPRVLAENIEEIEAFSRVSLLI
jgi:isopenicillin N synthase-like dioxygenase